MGRTLGAADMNWTTDKPTKPGYYWWRSRSPDGHAHLVEVTIDGDGFFESGPPANFIEGATRIDTPSEEWATVGMPL
jgi:hypothetical protein